MKNFNGPLNYNELSREDIIDLILTLKDEKCLDVFYNVAYGITDLIFGENYETDMEKSDN